jgi:hypothetical protein
MIYAAIALWIAVLAAIANPKSQEIFNRGWWWRVPAIITWFGVGYFFAAR